MYYEFGRKELESDRENNYPNQTIIIKDFIAESCPCMSCGKAAHVTKQIVLLPPDWGWASFELCDSCIKKLGDMICDLQISLNQKTEC